VWTTSGTVVTTAASLPAAARRGGFEISTQDVQGPPPIPLFSSALHGSSRFRTGTEQQTPRRRELSHVEIAGQFFPATIRTGSHSDAKKGEVFWMRFSAPARSSHSIRCRRPARDQK